MTNPSDGRWTSLNPLQRALATSDLFAVVSPGNAAQGVNYKVTFDAIATGIASAILPNGTTAWPLVGNGTALAPSFQVLTVPGGGTGAAALALNRVLIGNGTSAIASTGVATTGFPLVGNGTSAVPGFAILGVPGGGIGTSSTTPWAVLIGGSTATSQIQSIATTATSGFVLTSQGTAAAPIFAVSSVGVSTVNGQTGAVSIAIKPQGRLTVASFIPVLTFTQFAQTTFYYTPYVGDQIPLYDGTNMVPTTFTQLSVLTTDTTKSPAAIGANKVNDWFIWNDAGTPRLGHGPDWTNDTTRSAGTALVMVKGILLNNATITNGPAASRGTYVGTTRSNGSSQLDWIFGASSAGGTAGFFGVWNMYNRCLVNSVSIDSTTSYTYASTTPRAVDGAAGSRASFVMGLAEDGIDVNYGQLIVTAATINSGGIIGVALDSTSTTDKRGAFIAGTAAAITAIAMVVHKYGPQIGFHFIQAIELSADGSTINFNVSTSYTGLEFSAWM